jgi:hypothetical protein
MITSFSNPNYGLTNSDALNSNLPSSPQGSDLPSTQYYDNDSDDDARYTTIGGVAADDNGGGGGDADLYLQQSSGKKKKKSRKKYAQIDLNAMGIVAGESMNSVNGSEEELSLMSPDPDFSLMSPDSALQSPYDRSDTTEATLSTASGASDSGLVDRRGRGAGAGADDTEDDDDTPYSETAKSPGGFLSYYASLEMSAKARELEEEEEREEREDGEEEEEEEEVEDDIPEPQEVVLGAEAANTTPNGNDDSLKVPNGNTQQQNR